MRVQFNYNFVFKNGVKKRVGWELKKGKEVIFRGNRTACYMVLNDIK